MPQADFPHLKENNDFVIITNEHVAKENRWHLVVNPALGLVSWSPPDKFVSDRNFLGFAVIYEATGTASHPQRQCCCASSEPARKSGVDAFCRADANVALLLHLTIRLYPVLHSAKRSRKGRVSKKCTFQLNKLSCLYKEIDFTPKQPAAFSHTAGTLGKNTHVVFESVCVYTGRDLNNNHKKIQCTGHPVPVIPDGPEL